jgi:hypothetical protein
VVKFSFLEGAHSFLFGKRISALLALMFKNFFLKETLYLWICIWQVCSAAPVHEDFGYFLQASCGSYPSGPLFGTHVSTPSIA